MEWFLSWYKYVWILFLLIPYLIWTFGSIFDIIFSLIHQVELEDVTRYFIQIHILLFFLGSIIVFLRS